MLGDVYTWGAGTQRPFASAPSQRTASAYTIANASTESKPWLAHFPRKIMSGVHQVACSHRRVYGLTPSVRFRRLYISRFFRELFCRRRQSCNRVPSNQCVFRSASGANASFQLPLALTN